MVQSSINLKTASGHQVLAAAGKQVLRPGGRSATEQLLGWANPQPGETVLELAASFGHSAIALAQRYGVRVVGIEQNPDSVAQARLNIEKAGLTDQVTIREGDIFHLDQVPETFDCVLAEAILTMQSAPGKAKILAGVGDRLKPGGCFLSHELLADGPDAEIIQKDLAAAIRVNAQPLSTDGWIAACRQADLTVQHHTTGPMALLNPQRIAQDEGLPTLLTIGWTMLTRPVIRDRIFTMRQVFRRHANHLGYIILCVQKPE
ncbi:MAG: SAM-dependent methyltransferase [Nodosilinea sp.]